MNFILLPVLIEWYLIVRIWNEDEELFVELTVFFRSKRIFFTDKTKGTIEMYDILSGTRSVLYSSLSQPTQLSYSPSTGLDIVIFPFFNFSFNITFYFDSIFNSIAISRLQFHFIYLLQTIAVLRIKNESFSQISVIEICPSGSCSG